MPGIEGVRLHFDSRIAICLVERREPWHGRIRTRLGRLAKARLEVAFTDLNRLECRTAPLAWNRLDMLADYDEFLAATGMIWRPLQTAVFDLATEPRARHRLKTPDALHLSAAISSGGREIWTNDLRRAAAAAGRSEVVAFAD